jgi:hypothetical protein
MDVEHITLFGSMAFGKPVGRCIYCGSDGGKEGLSDEHIVAFCLANNAYLPKASCTNCAKQTSYLEGYAGRQIFGPLRIHFGIQSRRKSVELDPVGVIFQTDRGEELRRIPREKLPPLLTLPILEPPGLFHDQISAPIERFEAWTWVADNPDERMQPLIQDGDRGWKITTAIRPIVFARMLAKIAHTFAVARLGLDSFKHFLPPLILGEDDKAAYLIGGAAPPTAPLPAIPYSDKTHHHTLTLTVMGSPGKPDVIAMTIRLFEHIGSPTYWVIVGEPLPAALDQLRAKDADPAS